MCDLFGTLDARATLHDRKVLFLGDSNIRSFYKDLVFLLENNRLMSHNSLKNKLGSAVPCDIVKESSHLHRGRDYYEIREYKNRSIQVNFHFLTKCYTPQICHMFKKFKEVKEFPDIIIMNSCLWDISRWGPNGVAEYKDNLVKLMKLLKSCLPPETLFIWTTVPPVSNNVRGGLLVQQVQFLQHSLRFDVMEGNMFARDTVASHGFDVLDIHYYLRMQIHWRAPDGIHWSRESVRHVTNLILSHICLALSLKFPGNITGHSVIRFKALGIEKKKENSEIKLPKLSNIITQPNTKSKKMKNNLAVVMNNENVMSPMRKVIKQRRKLLNETCDDANSTLNSSCTSLEDSFKVDASLGTSSHDQHRQNNQQDDSRSVNLKRDIVVEALLNSPTLQFKEHERRKWTGPIRFHHVDRRHRTRGGPYSYY